MPDIEHRLTLLEERMRNTVDDLAEMKADVRDIRDALVGAKGGRKMLAAWIVAAGAAGSFLPWLISLFHVKP